MKLTSTLLAVCLLAAAPMTAIFAQQPAATASAMKDDMADGEIRKIDKENKKVTIKHSEIKSLDMPAMTMVFKVKDSAMLDKLSAGDKVKFKAIQTDGGLWVTELQTIQ